MISNPEINKQLAGIIKRQEVYFYNLQNKAGNRITICNYGAAITSFIIQNKKGRRVDCVIGFDNLKDYLQPHPYFGSLVGRFSNRIKEGKFVIDDLPYQVSKNHLGNHLHGGFKGFDKKVWEPKIVNNNTLELSYFSKDGEEGYPGNLTVKVRYTFGETDELKIEYHACSDKPTPINLTNHSYFNLSGSPSVPIYGHWLKINSKFILEVDQDFIPSGVNKIINGTEYDFVNFKKIPDRDFDQTYLLSNSQEELILAATVQEREIGLELNVFTTEPCLQFYSGNYLDGAYINKNGRPIVKHSAFCLETQHLPDSPNHPLFPNSILYPNKEFNSTTVYQIKAI